MLIPSTLDEYVRDSRDRVADLRRQYPDNEDFDRLIRQALGEVLAAQGFNVKTITFTVRAIFG